MAPHGRVLLASSLLLLLCPCALAADAPKVQLALYYETLCPYCSRFIVNHLSKIFTDGLLPIVDLKLLPYGNAMVTNDGTIRCQHGPNECLLNTVEACAIHAWPNVTEYFKFIYCVEELVVEGRYMEWESCFQKLGLNSQPVHDCYSNGYGKQLELYYAAETDALVPPHKYVPWVVVDGRPLYDDYENFEIEVCKAYKGESPQACEELVLAMSLTKKRRHAGNACYPDKKLMHLMVHASSN